MTGLAKLMNRGQKHAVSVKCCLSVETSLKTKMLLLLLFLLLTIAEQRKISMLTDRWHSSLEKDCVRLHFD